MDEGESRSGNLGVKHNIKPNMKANEPESQTGESTNNNAIENTHKDGEACRGVREWGLGKASGIC